MSQANRGTCSRYWQPLTPENASQVTGSGCEGRARDCDAQQESMT
jgi:hypothetical protein